MYQNFVNLTEAIKNKANKLIYIFNFPITLPDFYTPERGLIDTLRVVVSNAGEEGQSQPSQSANQAKQAATALKAGLKVEESKGEELDAIQNVYFDCNALDRLNENATAASVPEEQSNPNEELKMDKDLGLFEMINAGDFSTVSANPGAAAAAEQPAGGNFDFDAYAAGQ